MTKESKAVVKKENGGAVNVWAKKEKIRMLFAPKLSDEEFSFFLGLGISMGANPFAREIWAVKFKENEPAAIFLARDFYRKKAQEQNNYDGHTADAIYSNDEFFVEDGVLRHKYSLKDRGVLVGGYAIAYRKDLEKPFYVHVELKEYSKDNSTKNPWVKKPATMIKKVAEAQVLRMAWQSVFSGTYSEDEQWECEVVTEKKFIEPPTQKKLKKGETNGSKDTGSDNAAQFKKILDKFSSDLRGHCGDADSVEAWLMKNAELTEVDEITDMKTVMRLKSILAKEIMESAAVE